MERQAKRQLSCIQAQNYSNAQSKKKKKKRKKRQIHNALEYMKIDTKKKLGKYSMEKHAKRIV